MNKYIGLGLLIAFLAVLKLFSVAIASAITITLVLGVALVCDLLERNNLDE
jgi:hypothetical protein